ncbi:probable serine/threonine-protein kinase DDB_G0283337 [Apis mellifera]|uniref:Probable serine/threonine-protein kinase DDB_G0283337 n=1 Tax=Apis mellifera TaxID=7460 RepID=A0A7M7MVY0_APIME|nr:probable serine/threonine-protein kinase DDB_G0283337 [Apis mellifera]|eukprot:XP_026301631.1 probable serine/threonine-protein kinase DDB_G0283337 [Apis mellifera]
MQDLCPLCLKSGIKKKIKLLQINLQEAVWMCEEEKCIWPLGYEDFLFCPRAVGKIWSCYWDDYKPTITKLKENITSTKSSLCNTLISPMKQTSKETIDDLSMYYIENINITNNDSNIINSKTILDQSTSVLERSNMIGNIDIKKQYNDNNIILNKEINNINIHNKNFQLNDNDTENIKIKNEWINTLSKNIKEENISSIENIKNVNRRTPKITNVEKTNIDISSINVGNQISVYQDSNKKILNIEPKDIAETKLISKIETLPNLESNKNSESVLKSNLNVTKMEIDGLPPITLSFEIPLCTTTTKTVKNIIQKTDYKSNNTKSNSLEIKNTFVKRNITSGKQYEKFSFSAIKKNKESSNSNIINNINNNSLNMKTNPTVKTENYLTETNINAASIANQFNNSITSFNQENITSDILATNNSINIDTVLEDYLTNDYNVSEDINDEWINSLLS